MEKVLRGRKARTLHHDRFYRRTPYPDDLRLPSDELYQKRHRSANCDAGMALGCGIFGGIAIGLSALFQGKIAAASADALGATGKGTANYFIVIGIAETVALFTLVFCLLLLNS